MNGTYKSHETYRSHSWRSKLLPASGAAAKTTRTSWATAGPSAESGRTLLVILRSVLGGKVLAYDDQIAFFQITFDHFRRRAVGNAELDPARLRLLISAEHPDDAHLHFLNWQI